MPSRRVSVGLRVGEGRAFGAKERGHLKGSLKKVGTGSAPFSGPVCVLAVGAGPSLLLCGGSGTQLLLVV